MERNKRCTLLLWAGALGCLLAFLLSLLSGELPLTPGDLFRILFRGQRGTEASVLLYSRLPRTLGALFAGGALSLSGAVLQRVLSNQLASPGIVGVNAGAGFGVTLCCSLGILSGWAVSAFAFGGSLLAVLVLSFFASRASASKTTVILGGVALNSILGAFSEALGVLNRDVAALTTEFRVGGFSAVTYGRLIPGMALILLGTGVLFTLLSELDLVSLGDDTARGLGLPVRKYRVLFLLLAALLGGAAVSFTGLLGFVGLLVPHFARKLAGSQSRYLLPLSALLGGAFVTLCDTLSRWIFLPYEFPVGILMAILGAPVFGILLVQLKGGHRNA